MLKVFLAIFKIIVLNILYSSLKIFISFCNFIVLYRV
nr:MAG TPA: hypothetical protein [Caudoviricetes sp.]